MAEGGLVGWWRRARTTWLTKDKRIRILLWVGVVGILLIGASELLAQNEPPNEAAVTLTAAQVEQALEERITALLGRVEGVGACRVMVTLESDARAVYAADTTSSLGADGSSALSEQYLTVDTAAGPVGLLLTHLQPTVKGVAVVCDGGGSPTVQQRVVQVVSTAFHVSERRVCVVKAE